MKAFDFWCARNLRGICVLIFYYFVFIRKWFFIWLLGSMREFNRLKIPTTTCILNLLFHIIFVRKEQNRNRLLHFHHLEFCSDISLWYLFFIIFKKRFLLLVCIKLSSSSIIQTYLKKSRNNSNIFLTFAYGTRIKPQQRKKSMLQFRRSETNSKEIQISRSLLNVDVMDLLWIFGLFSNLDTPIREEFQI